MLFSTKNFVAENLRKIVTIFLVKKKINIHWGTQWTFIFDQNVNDSCRFLGNLFAFGRPAACHIFYQASK